MNNISNTLSQTIERVQRDIELASDESFGGIAECDVSDLRLILSAISEEGPAPRLEHRPTVDSNGRPFDQEKVERASLLLVDLHPLLDLESARRIVLCAGNVRRSHKA
jgi:hypothetical protein